ncbi:MAG: right-handed parallel beta-helix repeat-containing protein [Verrucomicrobiota bacterium JB024]|nr:right-handed parallel beta-helix repeat-containing protein [Verrucomicrobiota bacterium JB024]
MKRLLTPWALCLIFLLACGLAHAERMETRLVAEAPAVTVEASFVDPQSDQGMAWKWNGADRRDYGQTFTVDRDFQANTLAVGVLFSDHFRRNSQAPFRLVFESFSDGGGLSANKMIVQFEGTLPPNEGIPHDEAAWLLMRFPAVEFQAGHRYGFVLQFSGNGGDEQLAIFRVIPSSSPDGGFGFMSNDGQTYTKAPSLNFILGETPAGANASDQPEGQAPVGAGPRVLRVDQRGGAPYASIAQAVAAARAGDTIQLAPGSGPYREPLHITASGTPEAPIIFDGSGETVTGFEPLRFERKDGQWVCELAPLISRFSRVQGFEKQDGRWTSSSPLALPTVITYKGERLFQDARTGQLSEYARLSEDRTRLVLLEGVEPTGWEIASRDQVVVILNASHQIYRNLTASGSLNDGFNLHGKGAGLVFENIRGIQNLDEGFSAHDDIVCEIRTGSFSENDNGIGNVARSVMTAENVRCYNNAGWGIWIYNCEASLAHVTAWGNGVAQIALQGKSTVSLTDVFAVSPRWSEKPWISAQESARVSASTPYVCAPSVELKGEATVLP